MRYIPYSASSFRATFEREQRKHNMDKYLPKEISQQLTLLATEHRNYKNKIRSNDTRLNRSETENFRKQYWEGRKVQKDNIDSNIDRLISDAFDEFNEEFKNSAVKWKFVAGPKSPNRNLVQIDLDLSTYLASRQASWELLNANSAIHQDRNGIVRALKDNLSRTYPFALIRLDISKFYDSINHQVLVRKLSNSPYIDPVTKQLCFTFIKQYAEYKKTTRGLPQGVGLSSALSEYYVHELDNEFKRRSGVLFYARYVDDIIIVTENKKTNDSIYGDIQKVIQHLKLNLNIDKTYRLVAQFPSSVITSSGNQNQLSFYCNRDDTHSQSELTYLGYTFEFRDGHLCTDLSQARLQKQKNKMELAFSTWKKQIDTKPKERSVYDGLLLKRIQFLTTNTTLHKTNDRISVGIFFSNDALDSDSKSLKTLDNQLSGLIKKYKRDLPQKLRDRLEGMKYSSGFNNRTFIRLSPKRSKEICECWENIS